MNKIGFIGLGVMGEPIARRLLQQQYPLTVFDTDESPLERVRAAGAAVAQHPLDIARRCNTVFIMVRNEEQVDEVLFGNDGMAPALTPEHGVILLSTLSAGYVKDLTDKLPSIPILDAPVSGGRAGAESGQLTIMAGADPVYFEKFKRQLDLIGNQITYVGEVGAGQTAKAANQIIIALTRAAVGEAMMFARQNEVDPEIVRKAIATGLAGSATLDSYGPRITKLDNPVQFNSEILAKDVNNIARAASKLGLDLPFLNLVRDAYNSSLE
ncbi:MAG: NAD(P)-dependent oxidoreductase [Gammaproteobacteria bacterium]|nr:NAD(P)-dependent oxidoreductase [Gammaproteobacteria bacterium]